MNDSHKGVGKNGTLLGTRKLGSLHLFFQVPNFLDVGSNPVSWGNGSCTTTLGVGGIFLYQFGACEKTSSPHHRHPSCEA